MEQNDIDRYFDWAATAPSDKDILEASLAETFSAWGNPSSVHSVGKEAKRLLEKARALCAASLGVPSETIYFTSGGTESDCIPLLSLLNRPQKGTVLVSSIEHPAVREQAESLTKCGWRVVRIPATTGGIITKEAVLSKLTDDTALVCVMAVNNETGAIQPIKDIADALAKAAENKRKAKLHVDCVQAAGKIPLDLSHAGIASAAFSAHKIGGPRGIGILYLADTIESFFRGGGQEKNIRSGTENVFGALAFARCLERYCISNTNEKARTRFETQKKLTKSFIQSLSEIAGCTIIPEARLDARHEDEYSPWIVQASFKNIPGQVMLRALDAEGFCVSTGSACSSHKGQHTGGSAVLQAMNVSASVREGAVRFSFGPRTSEDAMKALSVKAGEIAAKFA